MAGFIHVKEISGKLNFFKVRELSGNFKIYRGGGGNEIFCPVAGKCQGIFHLSRVKS